MALLLPESFKNPPELLKQLRTRPESYWLKRGERRAIALFKEMARRVPAYKAYLRKEHVNSAKVRTIADFKKFVPLVSKESYLKKYPLESVCWDGKFKQARWDIAATSGSTGEPFYFPRESSQDWQYAAVAELYLLTHFDIHKKSTLYVNAFPLGIWIGGLFTYQAIKLVAERGDYNLSIINPGINKEMILKVIKRFGKDFDQVVIGCYGPFLKDALDEGVAQGMNWKDYNVKFIFSAEGFSETFRDYVAEVAGLKNIYKDTLNHYGTVDLGTMSYETPLAILLRRLATRNEKLYHELFPVRHKLPTLTQFFPELFYFEYINNTVVCSAYSGLPLVRYDLKDHGDVFTFTEMVLKCKRAGVDIMAEAKKAGISDTVWRLPFVQVYERSDFSVSLYAFQVYPETIKKALLVKSLHKDLTGKFTMITKFDTKKDQYLEINVELKPNRRGTKQLEKMIIKSATDHLVRENTEYAKTHSEIPHRMSPKIVFWKYEDPTYFKPGTKQKWVKRN